MPKSQTKRLLVEGKKDKRVFPFLMEKNGVDWPQGNEPVDIKDLGRKLLTKPEASAILKESSLRHLGVILDADDDTDASWRLVKGWFQDQFLDMPDRVRTEGFISEPNADGIRLGVWIMPDNQTRGMLETFLMLLVRDQDQELWAFAKTARDEAQNKHNAPFKPVHGDKAWMHTFLAWQDEPGPQLHEAVDHAILDPESPHSQPFVAWFRKLFEV